MIVSKIVFNITHIIIFYRTEHSEYKMSHVKCVMSHLIEKLYQHCVHVNLCAKTDPVQNERLDVT